MRSITINDRPFTLLGLVDHIKLDDTVTKLYHWRAHCTSAGCKNSWEFKTTALNRLGQLVPPEHPSRHYDKRFTHLFCLEHRPRKPRATHPTTYQSRTRVTDADVAQMRAIAASHQGTRNELYQGLSFVFGITPGTAREIIAGRKRNSTTTA